jgi:hypothetical protein
MDIQELRRRFPLSKRGIDVHAVWDSYNQELGVSSASAPPWRSAGRTVLSPPPEFIQATARLWELGAEEGAHALMCEWRGGRSGGVDLTNPDDGRAAFDEMPERASDQCLVWAAGMAGMQLYYQHYRPGQRVPDGRGHDRQQHALACGLTGLAAEQQWNHDVACCRELFEADLDRLWAVMRYGVYYRYLDGDEVRAAIRSG